MPASFGGAALLIIFFSLIIITAERWNVTVALLHTNTVAALWRGEQGRKKDQTPSSATALVFLFPSPSAGSSTLPRLAFSAHYITGELPCRVRRTGAPMEQLKFTDAVRTAHNSVDERTLALQSKSTAIVGVGQGDPKADIER